ncbi:MAG: arabinan endo-1,5-alpha-L-arabinosidase [Verrucomicrobia bacterium]|nr:MAG: arabinan endo-1,5-alpha-L-arabinosidase [Verrucomicrobiota bacterium]
MSRRISILLGFAGAIVWLVSGCRAFPDLRTLSGDIEIHDPSTIVNCGDEYRVFGTGRGIFSRHSKDLVHWEAGPKVFEQSPLWTTDVAPRNFGRFWAPDVIKLRDRYLLYYSVSSWGSRESAIALATSPTLDSAAPNYGWQDRGIVVRTTTNSNHNAIDPSVMQDRDGRLWLAFGSYWTGIKLIELDPATGLRIATNSPMYSLASHESIEAACLHQRGNFYYLFVNWGQCCRGTNSTYEIRVGRSENITGPYLDRDGKDLMKSGGTLFLGTAGARIGPGHAGILTVNGKDFVSFHFYNPANRGRGTLAIEPLHWTADGWPDVKPAGKK